MFYAVLLVFIVVFIAIVFTLVIGQIHSLFVSGMPSRPSRLLAGSIAGNFAAVRARTMPMGTFAQPASFLRLCL